ncbi:MAG: carbamoyltransferase HypF, partial [Proteobacteria bacterium]|nr:carbamoyltransferase HypF [Pseudomonadota bacterium]
MIIGRRIRVRGVVQGVGFRPTVWRLAKQYDLHGQVLNDGEGVLIDCWGTAKQLDDFISALNHQPPPLARIDSIDHEPLNSPATADFIIVASQHSSAHTGIVADAASCQPCLSETQDPGNRRYRYPFTNCTHCGPRLTIIDGIPYDRANTSMAEFILCPECRQEYENPADRRFHAQPNACPVCGPKAWLEPRINYPSSQGDIDTACWLLQQGNILAIKGLGGFHLACDATNAETVARLRQRKQRYAKPFALMARNLDVIAQYAEVGETEVQLLTSAAAPIVLLETRYSKSTARPIAPDVAPGSATLGFMLPYTPLHYLILQSLDFPVIMTSGNQSDVPQCIDNKTSLKQLDGITDYWLLHNRDIRNRVDDSVVRVVTGKPRVLRRARGYAPASLPLPPGFEKSPELLAFGAELKNTFCMVKDGRAILSQHMGDLENTDTYIDYRKNIELYQRLFEHRPTVLVIDPHPEYLSSKFGSQRADTDGLPLIKVQHHHAHIAACLAENEWPLDGGEVLGIALDGLGFGDDGTLWGG